MSLLEDVFLEDEANEAEELERIIEGDEFEERRRSDSDENSEKEDEAEEDKRKVDPTKPKSTRVVKNPRVLLNPARLTGPRGIQVIPDHFKDFKFKGKGHEKEDLDLVLKKLEHWAYRLYPKFQFEDCLKKIETLGKKRPVAVHLHKIRSGQYLSEDTVVQKDSSDEDTPVPVQEDEFDKLLQQQIELARSTPAPNLTMKLPLEDFSPTKDNRSTLVMVPKATSSPSISQEQRERMLRSRKLAEERRLARLKNAAGNIMNHSVSKSKDTGTENTMQENSETTNVNRGQNRVMDKDTDEIEVVRKHNRSNVIDSSDEETVVQTNVSVVVDVHKDIEHNTENKNTVDYGKIACISLHEKPTDIESTAVNKIGCNDEAVNESNIDINDTNELVAVVEDNDIQNNNEKNVMCCRISESIEVEKAVNTSIDAGENITDNSGTCEELRYDDSDMHIDINDKSTEKKSLQNDNESQSGTMLSASDVIEDNSDKLNVIENSTVTTSDSTNIDNFTAELIDDIMDVDFSEDF